MPAAVSRRDFLSGGLCLGALALAAPPVMASLPASGERQIAFDILRAGSSIGRHVVAFHRSNGRLLVDIGIDISVSFAFIPVFHYRHRNREVWEQGRLVALDSTTEDDGRRFSVTARLEAAGLRVSGAEGSFLAPPDILPTSYWNPETVFQRRLLDSQHGRLLEVETAFVREEVLESGVPARRYRVSGDLDLELWYAGAGEWQKIAFEARGSVVSYARLETEGGDSG